MLGCWSTVLILPLLCDASDSLTPVCTKHCWVRSCMFPKQRQHLQQSMCVHIGIHLDNHRTALWGQTQGSHQHILSLQQHIQRDIYRVILPLLQPSSFLFAVQKPLWPRNGILCLKKTPKRWAVNLNVAASFLLQVACLTPVWFRSLSSGLN